MTTVRGWSLARYLSIVLMGVAHTGCQQTQEPVTAADHVFLGQFLTLDENDTVVDARTIASAASAARYGSPRTPLCSSAI